MYLAKTPTRKHEIICVHNSSIYIQARRVYLWLHGWTINVLTITHCFVCIVEYIFFHWWTYSWTVLSSFYPTSLSPVGFEASDWPRIAESVERPIHLITWWLSLPCRLPRNEATWGFSQKFCMTPRLLFFYQLAKHFKDKAGNRVKLISILRKEDLQAHTNTYITRHNRDYVAWFHVSLDPWRDKPAKQSHIIGSPYEHLVL